jgi:membrane protein YqaA with SNARE-associated domain
MVAGPTPRTLLRRIIEARSAPAALFVFAFLEGAVLPVPIEAVIAPYMQMRRDMIWRIAAIALAGFFASAIIGYAVGALFFDTLGAGAIRAMGWEEQFSEVEAFLGKHGFWAMIGLALTPLPTQVAMIAAGAFGLPPDQFALAVLIGRGGRVFGVALLVRLWGDRVVGWFTPRG